MKRQSHILTIIVLARFCCTSLWFAGNGIVADLIRSFSLSPDVVGHITSAVQLEFILGTLVFAFFSVADQFSPSRGFLPLQLQVLPSTSAPCSIGIACTVYLLFGF